MKKPQIFKRSKAKWEDEQKALADVMEMQSIKAENLKAVHDEKSFAWEVVQTSDEDNFIIAIADVENEQEAKNLAWNHLNTFEGNLKANHSETEYCFSKVR